MIKRSASAWVCVMLFLGGCSEKSVNLQIDDKKSILNKAPQWVGDPKLEGYIVEVGSAAPNSKDDISFQRAEAMADARDNLARLLKIEITNQINTRKMKNDNRDLSEQNTHISTQLSNLMVRMSSQQKMWVAENGQLFVLVGVEKSTLDSNLNKHLILSGQQ